MTSISVSDPASPARVDARLFDGKTAQARAVVLSFRHGALLVQGEGIAFEVAPRSVQLSDAHRHAPRQLGFPDGSLCEVDDQQGLERLLVQAGMRTSRIGRWQQHWRAALLALLLMVAVIVGGYRFALPWVSAQLAAAVPDSVTTVMDASTLDLLDRSLMRPTTLPASRQAALRARFAALDGVPAGAGPLLFRASDIGPNAFALPGGTLVMTDELVTLSRDDDALIGVLLHEAGHVDRRHALRQMVQTTVVGSAFAFWLGDFSSLLAVLPATWLELRHSRDDETEADEYAIRLLHANGLHAAPLAALLGRLDAAHAPSAADAHQRNMEWASTHPDTAGRIARLRQADRERFPD